MHLTLGSLQAGRGKYQSPSFHSLLIRCRSWGVNFHTLSGLHVYQTGQAGSCRQQGQGSQEGNLSAAQSTRSCRAARFCLLAAGCCSTGWTGTVGQECRWGTGFRSGILFPFPSAFRIRSQPSFEVQFSPVP